MARITIVCGILLILLGVGTYFGSSSAGPSPTALIPAAFGALLFVCGTMALRPSWRKHAMHVAATISLLGALAASGRGGVSLAKVAAGNEVNPIALGSVLVMAAVCWLLVALCVKSFVEARRRQAAQGGE